jgi:hypothetical protein
MIASRVLTGSVNAWLTEFEDVSVTVTVKVTGPAVGGMPLNTPLGSRVSQKGKPLAVKV